MNALTGNSLQSSIRKIERREWMLWASAVLVTLFLTLGLVSFVVPLLRHLEGFDALHMTLTVRGLVGIVLLFDIYTVYQQLQIHRVRRQLTKREEIFRLISENAADMIAVVDADGNPIYNSPAYGRILGYASDELKDLSALEQIHPDDRQAVQDAAKEARTGGVGRRIEYRMRRKSGTWLILESTTNAVLNSSGAVEKLVIVNRDITDRKHLEEQYRQAQKMEAVGRLSGGVAHDFNNLLGVIIGYSEFLQERLEEENPLRTSVDEILKAGHRAASLTRQLLAFSRQQVLDPKVLDLNNVVSDMEKLLRRLIGEDMELIILRGSAIGTVRADQGQLEQVIMNLAVNARDAMPDGGKLTIQTAGMVMDEIFIRRYPYPVKPGPYVKLTVSDTGIGMDADTKARAFEPFFTTKEKDKGTGLGLSTVYGVVKQSGGYIEVETAPGAGTTFQIYLPRIEEVVAQTERNERDDSESLTGSETVLVAEDETSLGSLVRNTLEMRGYTVLGATDGLEALAVSQRYKANIDLLLTDLVMPGMGGRALAEELTRERPEMRVVYMSGYSGQRFGEDGPVEPGSFFLAKPFSREGLARKVREALDSRVAVGPK
jgi:two-component system, cell cycle sensor histidine kinase and response regulator CckA